MKFSLGVLIFALSLASAQEKRGLPPCPVAAPPGFVGPIQCDPVPPSHPENPSYGLERGSFGAFVGGGAWISHGTHPLISGGIDYGLAKYFGLYAELGEGWAYSQVGSFRAGGGAMVSINNRSRIVPFARLGVAYQRNTLFGSDLHVNGAALHYAGGFDVYASRHFGIETQVLGASGISNLHGNSATITFGVFYRSH